MDRTTCAHGSGRLPGVAHSRAPVDRPSPLAAGILLGTLLCLVALAPAAAFELRLATDNDFLTNNSIDDDYYTFGMRIELSVRDLAVGLSEEAFTNRPDEFRFDETRLTVGRLAPRAWLGKWWAWGEAGVLRLGQGLLGQSAQNTVHELIGSSRVELPYIEEEDTYAFLGVELGRQYPLHRRFTLGPQLTVRSSPGFKTNTVAGVRSIWKAAERITLDVTLGGRFTDTSFQYLDPFVDDLGPALLVELELPYAFVFEWSLNRYGTDREHVSFGYRIGAGGSPRRTGALRELTGTD